LIRSALALRPDTDAARDDPTVMMVPSRLSLLGGIIAKQTHPNGDGHHIRLE